MDRDTEVRIFLLGDERELRPLTADSLLGAMTESRELINEYGGYSELIERACVVSRGLFTDGGERLFESGREVLQTMTAEEIDFASSEYVKDLYLSRDRPAENREPSPEFDEEGGFADEPGTPENGSAGSAVREVTEGEVKKKIHIDTYVQERREENSGLPDADKMKLRRGMEYLTRRKQNPVDGTYYDGVYRWEKSDGLKSGEALPAGKRNGTGSEITDSGAAFYTGSSAYAGQGIRRDMSEVSDFFERDSRRYDSAIKLY